MQGPLILDRYRPIETMGEGANGKVELCWDTRIQRRVAIKRLPINNAHANGTIPGLTEARTGAMLSRPSIVSVYDFDVADDEAFLIMEAIEGPTLSQIIKDTPAGDFDLDIAAAILAAVGDAISFAHENQVLHLDIKPDNILITKSGACKVSDFGVSELASAQGFGKAAGGTIGYMPPEQMRRRGLDERCDEFALAAVAYEILTGRRPFGANSIQTSEKLINRFDVAPPSTVRNDLDAGIDNVFYTALAPKREDRYPTVRAFIDALMPYLGNAAQGSKRLREIASDDDEFEFDDINEQSKGGILENISPRFAKIIGHLIATVLCWWVSASALFGVPALSVELAMIIALLPALGAAIKPPYGALIALAINGVALCIGIQAMPVLGIICIVVAFLWVLFYAREGIADTNCALCISPLQIIGFTPLAPMFAGLFLPPARAVAAAIIQALLMLSLGRIGGPELLFGSITNVSTWIIILGWVASAFVMSLLCSRRTRILSILGAVAAALILLIAQSIAAWPLNGVLSAPNATWIMATAISCVIVCIIGVFETPLQNKGE